MEEWKLDDMGLPFSGSGAHEQSIGRLPSVRTRLQQAPTLEPRRSACMNAQYFRWFKILGPVNPAICSIQRLMVATTTRLSLLSRSSTLWVDSMSLVDQLVQADFRRAAFDRRSFSTINTSTPHRLAALLSGHELFLRLP